MSVKVCERQRWWHKKARAGLQKGCCGRGSASGAAAWAGRAEKAAKLISSKKKCGFLQSKVL